MSESDLKAMCDAARWRLHTWIARSTGQHLRAMREAFKTKTESTK